MVNGALIDRAPAFFGSNPTLELARDHVPDHSHAAGRIIEAGDRSEILSAGVPENLGILHGDLLQRLQTISGEAGCDDREISHPAFGQ